VDLGVTSNCVITLYVPPFCCKSTTIIPEQTHGRSAPPTETNSDPWAAESHHVHSAIADADDPFAATTATGHPFESVALGGKVVDEANLFGSPLGLKPVTSPMQAELDKPEQPSSLFLFIPVTAIS